MKNLGIKDSLNMTRAQPKLILASASPRRIQLLQDLGLSFQVLPPQIPEILREGELSENFVTRLALEKALAVATTLPYTTGRGPPSPLPSREGAGGNLYLLGADTIVVLDQKIFGKPATPTEAKEMLQKISGKTHEVLTGFAIVAWPDKIVVKDYCRSKVLMKNLTADEIENYVQTGEPLDKAGAYAAQGIGKKFIERIDGSENNVIGLPTEKLIPWLRKLGLI